MVQNLTLTLRDRLSRLTFQEASRLLGARGSRWIAEGGKREISIDEQVDLSDQAMVLTLGDARATIETHPAAPGKLRWGCSLCEGACEHVGALLSLVLEEKTALGLAVAPKARVPVEALGEEELVARALREREERAAKERMEIRSSDPRALWTDYAVTNQLTGSTYRVALRGWERGESYCSCPDFRKNTLGTCKHLLRVVRKLRRSPLARRANPYRRGSATVHLRYGETLELRFELPHGASFAVRRLAAPFLRTAISDIRGLLACVGQLERRGIAVTFYPDAEEHVQRRLAQERLERLAGDIRRDPAKHPLRKTLLRAELLPYQLDGIAFAMGAGRAVLADDMGLGKTIQAIGVAELLAREAGIGKVLIVCPASLKSQWRAEISRFSSRPSQLVLGSAAERARQYSGRCFFTVCNYEQVLRDILPIEREKWDLIVLDEGQRIKNWEARTTRVIKRLRSRFALVLSGTPLENRLEELFSVVEFADERRLGPAFRFLNRHRVATETGKVLGYRRLDDVRERLSPVVLRRTRASVMQQLPPRTTEIIRITPTAEQKEIHDAHLKIVSTIVRKPFISEMDLLRLRKALLMCRMAANSTFLVERKSPGYSSKLDELDALLARLSREASRKIILFSEWTTMLDQAEPLLRKNGLGYVRLDGSVPQKERQSRVLRFQNDARCRAFLASNAGATGLNLQAADTVVNLDLPWNPAVLEQRIARAHRMGQKRPVQVFVLVTTDTIEERLLGTLSAKSKLAAAALDADSDVSGVDLASGMEELRGRLEVLLGRVPDAPVEVRQRMQAEAAATAARRDRVSAAAGELLGSAFRFISEVLPNNPETEVTRNLESEFHQRLHQCVEKTPDGRARLSVTLPDTSALDRLANSLSRVLAGFDSRESLH